MICTGDNDDDGVVSLLKRTAPQATESTLAAPVFQFFVNTPNSLLTYIVFHHTQLPYYAVQRVECALYTNVLLCSLFIVLNRHTLSEMTIL